MGFAIRAAAIHCSNCQYEGESRLEGPGRRAVLSAVAVLGAGILYWPLLLLAAPFLLWIACTPICHVCPRCDWRYAVPLDVHEAHKALASLCPCRTGAICQTRPKSAPTREDGVSSDEEADQAGFPSDKRRT